MEENETSVQASNAIKRGKIYTMTLPGDPSTAVYPRTHGRCVTLNKNGKQVNLEDELYPRSAGWTGPAENTNVLVDVSSGQATAVKNINVSVQAYRYGEKKAADSCLLSVTKGGSPFEHDLLKVVNPADGSNPASGMVTLPTGMREDGEQIVIAATAVVDGVAVTPSPARKVNMCMPVFHGKAAVPVTSTKESEWNGFKGTEALTAKGYTASGVTLEKQIFFYAYPKRRGALTSIKDGNGYDITGDFSARTVLMQMDGVSESATVEYYVYEMKHVVSIQNAKYIFS